MHRCAEWLLMAPLILFFYLFTCLFFYLKLSNLFLSIRYLFKRMSVLVCVCALNV
jgi:hypothetical protein